MDEADTYFEQRGDEFRGILNSGHTRDAAVVWRTEGDKFKPKAFSTWAPLAIAKIGKLPDTIASRSIIIEMRRKRADESVTRYRPGRDRPSLDELARKCARWAKDNLQKLNGADPVMPKQLRNRAADNWRPLFAIADAIGGDCPDRARRAALALAGDEIELTSGEQLLSNIRTIRNVYSRAASIEFLRRIFAMSWARSPTDTFLLPSGLRRGLNHSGSGHIASASVRARRRVTCGSISKTPSLGISQRTATAQQIERLNHLWPATDVAAGVAP